MKIPPNPNLTALGAVPPAAQRLLNQIPACAWLCAGTVVARPLFRRVGGRRRRHGPYYLWTCKVQGQTQCVALSRAQYQLLAQAIRNQRRVQRILERLHALTLKTILNKVPGVTKRK
jgi:hypothetical protein